MNHQMRGVLQLVGGTGEPTIYGMDKHLAVDPAWDDEWNAQPGWLAGGQSVLGTTVHTVSSAYLGRERVRGLQAMPP